MIVDDSNANTDLNGGTYDDPDATAGQITLDQVVPGVAYTVTETGVPTGYVGPAGSQTATPAPYASKTLTFVNKHGSVSWLKKDATSGSLLGGATFQVTGTGGAAQALGVAITVADNGAKDADPAAGQFRVVDLPTGTYTVTETEAPTGYDLQAEGSRYQTFTVSADPLDVTLTSAFLDPRKPGAIRVTKQDATNDQPLAGATFQLYADLGTVGQPDAGDVAVGAPQTVGASGIASWAGLGWGDYLVVETAAPTGYSLPSPAYWAVSIGAGNAGTTVDVVAKDPRALTTIEVTKRNVTGAPITLAPAQFGLYADSNANGVLDVGEPLVTAAPEPNPQWTTTDGLQASTVDGTVAWSGLDFGHYVVRELAAPQGYVLPAVTDHAFEITPANAGGTLTYAFVDPKAVQTLTVEKVGQQGETTEPVRGATFQLWKESNGVPGLQTTAVNETPADTQVDAGQTGADGRLTLPGVSDAYTITWPNTYYWVETAVPAPYNLPPNPASAPIVVTASTVAEGSPTTTFTDRVTTVATTVHVIDGTLPGASVEDTVTLGNIPTAQLSGTVTFTLYGPVTGDTPTPTCTTVAATETSHTFTMSTPDAGGYRTATATSPDVALTKAGTYYWIASFASDTPGVRSAAGHCGDPNETVTIAPAGVSISTQATARAVYGGAPIGDAATLTGVTSAPKPTGTVTFALYGPSNTATCTGTPVFTRTVAIPADVVVTGTGADASITVAIPEGERYAPTGPGTYWWVASYSGDANNSPAVGSCGDPNESTVVTSAGVDIATAATEQSVIYAAGAAPISDVATLDWAGTGVTPTGSVAFTLYGPVDPESTTCAGLTPTAGPAGPWTVLITDGMLKSDQTGSWLAVPSPQFTPTVPGVYRWAASYSGDSRYGPVTEACTAAHETSLVSKPGLDKTADPADGATVLVGGTIHYTITVTNHGPATLTDEPLVDTLPGHVTYAGDATALVTYDATARTLTWLVDLAPGASATFTYSVTVQTDTPMGTELVNTATFGGYEDRTVHYAGVQTPTLVKSAVPASGSLVQPGQAIAYTVTVGNTGNVAVTGDVVDHLPAYVTFTSVAPGTPTPSYDVASNILTWPSVTVAPGQPQTFVYTVTVSGTVPAGTTLTNTASFLRLTASTHHHTGEPTPSVDKSSPTEGQIVPRGDTIHYQITVANTGDYPVTAAPLVDTLPAGVSYVTDSAAVAATGGGTTTATQPMVGTGPPVTLTWTVTLPPGASVTVKFDATVDQTASGRLVNTATFQQKQDTTTHTVGVPVPSLVKSADPESGSTVQPGQVIAYTVTIGNTGNYPVTGPVVDTLPVQVAYQSVAEGTPTPTYNAATHTLTWPSVTLAAGASKTYVYTVQVGTGTPDNSTLVNRATFLDLWASTTHRTGAPGGGPDKTANPPSGSTVQPGQAISYTVTVSNTGTGPVRSQPAVDTLPDHVSLVPGSITGGGGASVDGRTITWTVSLPAGGSATYTYAVTVDADAPSGATLVNRVTFLGVEDTTTHTVASGALTIGKSVSPAGSAAFGDTLTYTLTVRASGDLAQNGVVVTDYLPGYDPARPSSGTTTYVAGSAACDGTCTVTYDGATHLLTWDLGTVPAGTSRVLTFQVVIDTPAAAADGAIPAVDITNAGAVRSARVPETPSNEVVTPVAAVEGVKISPPPTQPPTEVLGVKLPRTGPGLPVGLTVGLGALLIATGAGVSLAVRRRRSQL